MSRPKIYFASAITGLEDKQKEMFDLDIEFLESMGYSVFKPPVETTAICYIDDVGHIRNADAVVAYIGRPSTGMGIEMALAVADLRTNVICWKNPTDVVSPFVAGFCRHYGIPICNGIVDVVEALEESLIL